MRAPIQYLTAADGTVLACADEGRGTPCVYVSPLASHLEHAWDVDALRSFSEARFAVSPR